MTVDYQGIAVLIGAVTSAAVGIGSVILQAIVLSRQANTRAKLDQVHDLVNGQSHALNDAIEKGAFAAGQKAESDKNKSET